MDELGFVMWAAQAALAEELGRRCRVRGDQEFNFEEMQATRSRQSGCRNVAFTARLRAEEINLGVISTEKLLQPWEWMRPWRETQGPETLRS